MERADEEAFVTEPTPPIPDPGQPGQRPVFPGPPPSGPAYPGPPPPGYGPAPTPAPPPMPSPTSAYPAYLDPAYLDPAYVDPGAKSRMTAGLLGIFLGAFGVHRFYLGYTSIGVLQILVTIATCGIGGFWGIIEGILILGGTGIKTDADGRPLRP